MSRIDDFDGFDPDAPAPRTRAVQFPVVLLLDVSGSMERSGALGTLRDGVAQFYRAVHADPRSLAAVDLAVVGFAGAARVIQEFACPIPAAAPAVEVRLGGRVPEGTDLAAAVDLGLDMVDAALPRYARGSGAHKPLVVLLTDALPPSRRLRPEFVERQGAAAARARARAAADLHFVAAGVGPKADLATLARFTAPDCPPRRIDEAGLEQFVRALSRSVVSVSTGRLRRDGLLDAALADFPAL